MSKELQHIEFIAYLIHGRKTDEAGYTGHTRWLNTREETRQECIAEATRIFEDWVREELESERKLNEFSDTISIITQNKIHP